MHLSKNPRVLSKSTIAVVGGTGRMGRTLVRMLQSSGAKIVVCSRNPEKATRLFDVETRKIGDVQDADIVVVSVPIDNTVTTCRQLLKRMKPQSLLVDATSVKKGIVDAIDKCVPHNIEYLSIHPLFGPDVQDFREENVLAIARRAGPLTRSMLRFFSKCGMTTTHVTIDEHDRKTAVTQALHHYAYASLAVCMNKLMNRKDFCRFSTRTLRKTIRLIQCFSENADTILDIQRKNPYGAFARESFAKTVSSFSYMKSKKNRRIASVMKMFRELPCAEG